MIETENINIKYNCEVTSINRYLNSESHKICLMYTEIEDNEECEKLMECDALINATDISHIAPMISDITDDEKSAFSAITTDSVCYTLFEYQTGWKAMNESKSDLSNICDDGKDDGDESTDDETVIGDEEKEDLLHQLVGRDCEIMNAVHKLCTFFPEKLDQKNGHIFKIRNVSSDKDGVYKFIGYQLLSEEDVEHFDFRALQNILLDDLKDIGFDLDKVKLLKQNINRYCPRWTQQGINDGIPWLVKDELQGKYKNMYYVGSSMCFESIEATLEYNIQLQQQLGLF